MKKGGSGNGAAGRGRATPALLVLLLVVAASQLHDGVAAARHLGEADGRQPPPPADHSSPLAVSDNNNPCPSGCTYDPNSNPSCKHCQP
ncbi:hypothetical protein E2562_031241 [Oryza meyeriana var. granulata]|uniref:Uncharacterized protein n=1 Tax=Oryza meyeriana var. granulata TaxID=110450 RepID=A0A6G1DQS3_9ORYZ|nr:hypothetical protein E2562_031241 [Oryza meyeriana var. granulata]